MNLLPKELIEMVYFYISPFHVAKICCLNEQVNVYGFSPSELYNCINGSSLLNAVVYNNVPLVRLSMHQGQGVNLNIHTIDQETPLTIAARNGNIEIVRLLISYGAEVDHYNKEKSALHQACKHGHYTIVVELINARATIFGDCLVTASFGAHKNIVKLLLQHGANPNHVCMHGNTALYWAVYNNRIDIIKILIQYGVNINVRHNFTKGTVLYRAIEKGYIKVVELLLKHNINVNIVDHYDNKPLHFAASEGRYNIIKLLLKNDININQHNANRMTPLDFACYYNHLRCVNLLLRHGARVDTGDPLPIFSAVKSGNLTMVKTLINHGAMVKARNYYHQTLMHIVAKTNNTTIAEFLINQGLDINTEDLTGRTPLSEAANQRDSTMFQYLLENGGDINYVNGRGKTILYQTHNPEVSNILRAKRARFY